MRIVAPLVLSVVGIVGGGAVGYVMKPTPAPAAEVGEAMETEAETVAVAAASDDALATRRTPTPAADSAYVPLSRKLIVPIQRANGRGAFVALDVTLELDPEKEAWAVSHEPKTIDAFLRVIVSFAATGAFDDHAQAPHTLDELNAELLKAARAVLGDPVREVLIANLITQDA